MRHKLLHSLNQPLPFKAGMAVAADDDVIMHQDAERFARIDNLTGHGDIRIRWCWVTGWMIVNKNDGRR